MSEDQSRNRFDTRRQERREQKFAKAQLRDQSQSAHFINSHQATIQYALAAIRGSMLLNGGGAIAILSYIATRNLPPNKEYFLHSPLVYFVAGAVLAAGTAAMAHAGQFSFTREISYRWELSVLSDEKAKASRKNGKIAKVMRIFSQLISIMFFIGSLMTFGHGCIEAYFAFQNAVMFQ